MLGRQKKQVTELKKRCKNVCKKFQVRTFGGVGRYSSGQAHCQVCEIWIDHRGCHVMDGSKARENTLGWFCNCCNRRVRQSPRGRAQKERLKSGIVRYVQADPENSAVALRARGIIRDTPGGIYEEDLRKEINVVKEKMAKMSEKISRFKNVSMSERRGVRGNLFEFRQDREISSLAKNLRRGRSFTARDLESRFCASGTGPVWHSSAARVVLLLDSERKPALHRGDEFVCLVGHGTGNQTARGPNAGVIHSKERRHLLLYFKKTGQRFVYKFPVEYVSHERDRAAGPSGITRGIIRFKLRIRR